MKLVQEGPIINGATRRPPAFKFEIEPLLDSGPLLGSLLIVITGLVLAFNYLFGHVFAGPAPHTDPRGGVHDHSMIYTNPDIHQRARVRHYVHR